MAGDAGLGAPKEPRSPAGFWAPRPARTRPGPGAHRPTAYGPARSRRPPAPKPPFQVLADTLTKNLVHPPVTAVIISTAGRVLADTITTTVAVGVLVLLYADLRMRQEGLDRALQVAAQDTSADGDKFAAMWAVSGTH